MSAALQRPEIAWWLADFWGPSAKDTSNRQMADMMQNAPFTFAPDNGLAFFEELGWRVAEAESLFDVAYRFRRVPWAVRPLGWLPTPDPRRPGRRLCYTAALLTGG